MDEEDGSRSVLLTGCAPSLCASSFSLSAFLFLCARFAFFVVCVCIMCLLVF